MNTCKDCKHFYIAEDNGLEYCHCEYHGFDNRYNDNFSDKNESCEEFEMLDYLKDENKALNLLNKWFEITKFDPDKKTFNLFDMDDWQIQRTNEFIIKICNEFDDSGLVPLIYVKHFSEKYFKNLKVSVLDILQNHYDDVKVLQTFYDDLNSNEIKKIEKDFSDKLKMLSASICSKKYLDDNKDNNYIEGLGDVIDNITKLKVDIFLKGGEIKPITKISKSVHYFDCLANCLLALENADDGMYLCYISAEKSVDGYFGYFIKNNGNIFSINERIDEIYIGQHGILRNNRYLENKLYNIFPYDEIVEFSGQDYKGYATNISIDNDKLSFENFKTSTFNCIILTMYLLSKKYVGKKLDGEQVFVNSLLKQNMKSLEHDNNEIMLYNNKSEIMKYNHSFEFKIDEDKFLSGELCKKYDKGNYFQNINQILVDNYGQDFNFQEAYKDILVSDKTKLLTTEQDKDVPNGFNNEFIGSKDKMELQAFYELRKKLAIHIENNMIQDYKDFGGREGLIKWWKNLLLNNINNLKNICKNVHINPDNGDYIIKINGMGKQENKFTLSLIKEYTDEDIKNHEINIYTFTDCNNTLLNPIKDKHASRFQYLDLDDNHVCKYFFCFKPYNWQWIENTFNIEVPKFLKGWFNSHYFESPYTGNHILNVVDPVDRLGCITNWKNSEYRFNFNFFIGFSTNNFKKIIK